MKSSNIRNTRYLGSNSTANAGWVRNPSPNFKTSLDKCYEHAVGRAHTYYIYEIL